VSDNTGILATGNYNLCTTLVTDMSYKFRWANSFNSDISFWDVSNVTDMSSLFYGTNLFNQDISGWDTSKVTTMYGMFNVAYDINNGGSSDINNWNTSNVTSMDNMFYGGSGF